MIAIVATEVVITISKVTLHVLILVVMIIIFILQEVTMVTHTTEDTILTQGSLITVTVVAGHILATKIDKENPPTLVGGFCYSSLAGLSIDRLSMLRASPVIRITSLSIFLNSLLDLLKWFTVVASALPSFV